MKGIAILVLVVVSVPSTVFTQDTTCGIVWEPIIQLSKDSTMAISPHMISQGDTIHVTWDFGGGYRLPYARSTNDGLSWEPTRELLPDSITFPRFAHDPRLLSNSKKIYIFFIGARAFETPVEMMYSSDQGMTWSEPEYISPDSKTRIWGAAIQGDTIVISYPRWGPYLLRSTNGGVTWDTTLGTAWPPITLSPGVLHNAAEALTQSVKGFNVAYKRSTDVGDTWSDSIFLSTLDDYVSDEPAIGVSYIGDSQSIIFTNWRDGKYGYRTLVGGSILMRRSTDNGLTWQPEILMTEIPNGCNNDFTTGQIAGNENRIGITWTDDELGHIDFRYSLDRGNSWSSLCDVTIQGIALLSNCAITKSAFHLVWADKYEGFWGIYYRRGVLLPSIVNEESQIPSLFSLEQNYPNPFNPKTNIRFRISDFGFVSLKVYDVFGREVTTLVNERKPAGEYKVEWDPSTRPGQVLPSGVYYYRLISGNYHAVGKAILIK